MQKIIIPTVLAGSILLITACDKQPAVHTVQHSSGRWYTQEHVNQGKVVFHKNCAICHGKNAEKTINWKQRLDDGSYPPPPLNGTGHAWHHPMTMLLRSINEGGAPVGGKMPSFKHRLSKQEKLFAIAYFQHFWSDDIYSAWLDRGGLE